jgi:hypothetical protein
MWGEKLAQNMHADAGFTTVELHEIPEDIAGNYNSPPRAEPGW